MNHRDLIKSLPESVRKRNEGVLGKVGSDKAVVSKYGAVKVEIDGYVFDSIREGERYKHLRLLLERGLLRYLFLQYEFQLNYKGSFGYKYRADFVWSIDGNMVVEDCKGALTAVFKKKQKLMKRIYNIDILLT